MEKLIIEDGTYKIIYKLPTCSVLEFDFSFKKGENYESALAENFSQEKIPKILLSDIDLLMNQFLYEERKGRVTYSKFQKENLNSKNFLRNVINEWLSVKTFKNHIERM
jgi:hypothetical protein